MPMTLDQFTAEARRRLTAEPGAPGREKLCALVRDALADPGFVAANLPADGPERQVLYEDPELGFTVLAHAYRGAKNSKPHDHGPSWAIYGQAAGITVMTDWDCLIRPTETAPGQARYRRDYALTPGMAYLYNEGDLHSPRRDGATVLLRIEGVNMDRVKRLPYEAVEAAAA